MTLKEELQLDRTCVQHRFTVSSLSQLENAGERIDEIAEFIRTTTSIVDMVVDKGPVTKEFGRRISEAFVSNKSIKEVSIGPARNGCASWLENCKTLRNMENLQTFCFHHGFVGMTDQEAESIFSLLLTGSHSLKFIDVTLFPPAETKDDCDSQAAWNGLALFLSQAATCTSIEHLQVSYHNLPEMSPASVACFPALCRGIAVSALRELYWWDFPVISDTHSESMAHHLSQAIALSSLERVFVRKTSPLYLALLGTEQLANLDYAFSWTAVAERFYGKPKGLCIQRCWKSAVCGQLPMGLWPHILQKAHTSPEESHGSLGIMFCLLRQKPDLVLAHPAHRHVASEAIDVGN